MDKLNTNIGDILTGAAVGAAVNHFIGEGSMQKKMTNGAIIGGASVVFGPLARGLVAKLGF